MFTIEEKNWHFGFAPEIAAQFPLGDLFGYVSATYYYALAAGTSIGGDDGVAWQYLSFRLGLVWEWW